MTGNMLKFGRSVGMNGTHSPLGLNGRTPSPPSAMPNSTSNQQLPPACGARQLSKLKRFLTTLQQFGSDISPDIGERVRTLVLGLVNSHLSIEEFHSKLQEATNFPLRPFVIPFLKANLPLLQRELLHCARMAKQTPQQYLAQNEHILFDTSNSPVESHDSLSSDLNENGKRRSPDRPAKENGIDPHIDNLHPTKRHHTMSPLGGSRVSPNGVLNLNSGGPIRLGDISLSRELRERERLEQERAERERLERERDRDRHYPNYSFSRNDPFEPPFDRLDDNWKHVETMLHCIIGMVNKTKRALSVLQERSIRDREELSLWMRRHAEEEAVTEVKRQAMLELQKAVSAVEQKANELVANERQKMDRALVEARKQAHDEVLSTINHQEDSSESCWNCGRKASETCSGCNTARYCGSFCQHKDWEQHHHVCGKNPGTTSTSGEGRESKPQLVTPQLSSSVRPSPPPPISTSTPATTPQLSQRPNVPPLPPPVSASRIPSQDTPILTPQPSPSPNNSVASAHSPHSGSRSSTPAENSRPAS